jgi:hypothetical protein
VATPVTMVFPSVKQWKQAFMPEFISFGQVSSSTFLANEHSVDILYVAGSPAGENAGS